ncbi:MAG: DUF2335 domain-containing protein [Chloroflexi bacterium]|nr:DUF2335 domain-containing protein [Chloroflexota bacterium]
MSDASNIDDQPLDISELLANTPISAELIQDIPQEKRAEFLRAIVAFRLHIEQVEQYSGPIPHPNIVERFEQTLPGSADRILSMAEEQQTANIEYERQDQQIRLRVDMTAIQGLIWNVRLGMFLVVGLSLAIVLIGMRIIELGHSAEGFAVIVGAACGIGIAYMKSLGRGADQSEQSKVS